MNKAVLLHGLFNWRGGKGSVDKYAPYLRHSYPGIKIDSTSGDYGFKGVLGARYVEKHTDVIDKIAESLKDADLLIAHSNGARFGMKALQRISNPNIKIVFFSPALNSDWAFTEEFERCTIFCTRKDFPLWLAKFIPCSEMGDMGRVGAKTYQERVGNVFCYPDVKNHSTWFKKNKIQNYHEAARALNDLPLETYKRLGRCRANNMGI